MSNPGQPNRSQHLAATLFGFGAPIDRRTYVTAGVTLMALKYALDAAAVYASSGRLYAPWRFLSPMIATRIPIQADTYWAFVSTQAALIAMALWALVFMWIGVSLSVRRAVDAGYSGWVGLLFLVPLVNLIAMALLAIAPSSQLRQWQPPGAEPYRGPAPAPKIDDGGMPAMIKSALIGVAVGLLVGAIMLAISVYTLGSYGAVLFFLTPFMMTAVGGFVFNLPEQRGAGPTALLGIAIIMITGFGMLLLALEGAICIAMAAPIACTVGVLGVFVGRALAAQTHSAMHHAAFAAMALPLLAGAEARFAQSPITEVVSAVEIDAPPEKVWPHVIGFSELPQPRRAIFDLGIAYPVRARIQGSGVGAVRHCEFSTGPFVEPITRWQPPSRLSFDVAAQPHAMKEWSPFAAIYPPHLDHNIRSKRGEFRLLRLPHNRTRLEGSTWYQLDMRPARYWRFWADTMIHNIHARVLEHVKHLSEEDTTKTASR